MVVKNTTERFAGRPAAEVLGILFYEHVSRMKAICDYCGEEHETVIAWVDSYYGCVEYCRGCGAVQNVNEDKESYGSGVFDDKIMVLEAEAKAGQAAVADAEENILRYRRTYFSEDCDYSTCRVKSCSGELLCKALAALRALDGKEK